MHIPNVIPDTMPTTNLKKFRNRIAHPGDKPRIIKQKRDIKDLFDLLKSLSEWIRLSDVKA